MYNWIIKCINADYNSNTIGVSYYDKVANVIVPLCCNEINSKDLMDMENSCDKLTDNNIIYLDISSNKVGLLCY